MGSYVQMSGTFTGALSSGGTTFIGSGNGIVKATEGSPETSDNISVLVAGVGTTATTDATGSAVFGRNAKAEHPYSFLFSGLSDEVTTESTGTAKFATAGGLEGFYVGDRSMSEHFAELSATTCDALTGSSPLNNLVHLDGDETIAGWKRFTGPATFGSIEAIGSTLSISGTDGGNPPNIGFHYEGSEDNTSYIDEYPSGSLNMGPKVVIPYLDVDADLVVRRNSLFSSSSLRAGAMFDFRAGSAYVSSYGHEEDVSETPPLSCLVASKGYVDEEIEKVSQGQISTASLETLSVSQLADLTGAETYVGDVSVGNSSSLAANTKFVNDSIGSSISYLRGGSANIGSGRKPIFLEGGVLKALSSSVGGARNPIFLQNGELKATTETVGTNQQPIYLLNGSFSTCNTMVDIGTEQSVTGVKKFSSLRLESRAQIVRQPNQCSWWQGRDYAPFRLGTTQTSDGYSPALSIKSSTGSWEIGSHTSGSSLMFVFEKDSDYGNGDTTGVTYSFPSDGDVAKVRLGGGDIGSAFKPVYIEGGCVKESTERMILGTITFGGSESTHYIPFTSIPRFSSTTPSRVEVTVFGTGYSGSRNFEYGLTTASTTKTIQYNERFGFGYNYAAERILAVKLNSSNLMVNIVLL